MGKDLSERLSTFFNASKADDLQLDEPWMFDQLAILTQMDPGEMERNPLEAALTWIASREDLTYEFILGVTRRDGMSYNDYFQKHMVEARGTIPVTTRRKKTVARYTALVDVGMVDIIDKGVIEKGLILRLAAFILMRPILQNWVAEEGRTSLGRSERARSMHSRVAVATEWISTEFAMWLIEQGVYPQDRSVSQLIEAIYPESKHTIDFKGLFS